MSLVSEPVVPAGTPGAEGTGVGWQENTGVALPVGLTMTGLLWGTGSSAQPGEDTEDQGATVTPLFPSHVVILTLALWPPMGPKPSMPLGAMAVWPRSWGRGVAPTFRSAAPAKAPVGGRYREAGNGGHSAGWGPPSTPSLGTQQVLPNHFSGMW